MNWKRSDRQRRIAVGSHEGAGSHRGPRISARSFVVAATVMTLCFLLWQCLWAVLTPSFRGPDEVQHYNSTLRVATTGAWPDPGNAAIDSQVILAIHEAGFMAGEDDFFAQANITPLRDGLGENAGYAQPYASSPLTPHLERTIVEYGNGGAPQHVDQMTQHPPLYYQIVAGTMNLAGAMDWPWDRQLLFIRVVSALMTLPLIPSIVYTARKIGASRLASLVTGTFVFAIPQLVFATSVASNDALGIGAGALTIAGVASAMFGNGSWRPVMFSGVMLGIGLWSKGTFIPMGLVVGLAFLLNKNVPRWTRRLAQGISAGVIGVALGGFWWIRNYVMFGSFQPKGMSRSSALEGTNFARYVRQTFRLMVDSSWGQFGWLEWWLPWWLISVLALAALVSLVVSIVRGPDRMKRLNLVLFYGLVALVLIVKAWGTFQDLGYVAGVQGRYMFPGVVGFIVVCAAAWYPALDRYSTRFMGLPLVVPSLIAGTVSIFSFVQWAWACYYAPEGRIAIDWTRWSIATGFEISTLQAILFVGVVATCVAVILPTAIATISTRTAKSEVEILESETSEEKGHEGATPTVSLRDNA